MHLTGDPGLDRMVPAAIRLVCGLREFNRDEVAAAFADAAATSGENDGGRGLAVVLAAMVPFEDTPADLLAWVHRRREFERLLASGVDRTTAATLVSRPPRARRQAEGR